MGQTYRQLLQIEERSTRNQTGNHRRCWGRC